MDISNCHAVYTAATFACINYFARGPRPGDFLLFSQLGPPHWLPLLRGVRTITEIAGTERIAAGPLETQPKESALRATVPATLIFECPRLDWTDHFERLEAFVADSDDSGADFDALAKLACATRPRMVKANLGAIWSIKTHSCGRMSWEMHFPRGYWR